MKKELALVIILLFLFVCMTLGILVYVPSAELRTAFRAIFSTFEVTAKAFMITTGIGITLALVVGLIWLVVIAYSSGLIWYHNGRIRRAEAQLAEREANLVITVANPGSQVYRTITNNFSAVTSPLHLEPGWINGESMPITGQQQGRWVLDKVFNAQIKGGRGRQMLPEPEPITQLKPVLEFIRNEPCVAFWGGRGSGKTTHALHWLAHSRAENYVIDPKPLGLNPWPNSKVIGANGKFDEVRPSIERIYKELLHRQENGLLNEQPLVLLVDELYTLQNVHKLAIMDMVFSLIVLGREYGVSASFTTAAKGVKALGIEGMSGLAEALTFVHLEKMGPIYKCFVDMGEGEFEAVPCGPYYPLDQTPRQIPATIPMSEEEAIKKAVMDNPGASYGEIIRLANVAGSRPTATNRVKQVIEQFGLEEYKIGGVFPVK